MNNQPTEVLRYNRPAEAWTEALPIGNGRLGAMIFGGVNRDTIQLNEETVWGGYRSDKNNYQAKKALPEVRRLIFAGEIEKASKLASDTMISVPSRFGSYQTLGEITIQPADKSDYSEYSRRLDVTNAVASVSYASKGTGYNREYFVSAVDQVIVIRYSCDKPRGITLNVNFTRAKEAIDGRLGNDAIEVSGRLGEKGVCFYSALRMKCEGGKVSLDQWYRGDTTAHVVNADSATFFLAANTNYHGADPREECLKTLNAAYDKGYDNIRQDHIREYRSMYDRFSIELSDGTEKKRYPSTTSEWLEEIRSGQISPEFAALYVNYSRYLLLSSSRPGCLPSNLQGIWNDLYIAPWESDYHPNINMQMNYWPGEAYNLSECCEPVFDWLEALAVPGSLTAKVHYNADGWVIHHCSDIFGYTPPNGSILGVWPFGGAWMCMHLYEHYLYTNDGVFLKEKAYPLIKGAVRFLLDFMIEAPEGTACPGCLVTNPSHSPENSFIALDGSAGMLTYSATMDTEIISDLFTACLKTINILRIEEKDFDKAFQDEISAALKRLPPVKVSRRTGGIQEWAEDFEEKDIGHRHVSHLYGVYPGGMISPEKTPELAMAAKRTLGRKFESGYDGQGWSLSWIACIWARLLEPEKAYAALQEIFERHILYNLMISAHGYPQVGDAQGIPAALLEMLAQSHDDKISLLPALPKAWPNGSVKGMKLRYGYTLDMSWENGRLVNATLYMDTFCKDVPIKIDCKGRYKFEKRGSKITINVDGALTP